MRKIIVAEIIPRLGNGRPGNGTKHRKADLSAAIIAVRILNCRAFVSDAI
jgi:hypothetical protein